MSFTTGKGEEDHSEEPTRLQNGSPIRVNMISADERLESRSPRRTSSTRKNLSAIHYSAQFETLRRGVGGVEDLNNNSNSSNNFAVDKVLQERLNKSGIIFRNGSITMTDNDLMGVSNEKDQRIRELEYSESQLKRSRREVQAKLEKDNAIISQQLEFAVLELAEAKQKVKDNDEFFRLFEVNDQRFQTHPIFLQKLRTLEDTHAAQLRTKQREVESLQAQLHSQTKTSNLQNEQRNHGVQVNQITAVVNGDAGTAEERKGEEEEEEEEEQFQAGESLTLSSSRRRGGASLHDESEQFQEEIEVKQIQKRIQSREILLLYGAEAALSEVEEEEAVKSCDRCEYINDEDVNTVNPAEFKRLQKQVEDFSQTIENLKEEVGLLQIDKEQLIEMLEVERETNDGRIKEIITANDEREQMIEREIEQRSAEMMERGIEERAGETKAVNEEREVAMQEFYEQQYFDKLEFYERNHAEILDQNQRLFNTTLSDFERNLRQEFHRDTQQRDAEARQQFAREKEEIINAFQRERTLDQNRNEAAAALNRNGQGDDLNVNHSKVTELTEECAKLKTRMSQLIAENEQVRSSAAKSLEEVSSLKGQLKATEGGIKAIDSDIILRLNNNPQENMNDRNGLSVRFPSGSSSKDTHEKLVEIIHNFDEMVSVIRGQSDEIVAQLRQHIAELEKLLVGNRDAFYEERSAMESVIIQLRAVREQQLSEITSERLSYENKLSSVTSKLQTAERRLAETADDYQDKEEQLRKEISEIQIKSISDRQQIDSEIKRGIQSQRINENQEQVWQLQQQQNRADALEEKVREFQQQIEEITAENEKLFENNNALVYEKQEIEQQSERLEHEFDEQMEQFANEREGFVDTISQLRDSVNQMNQENQLLIRQCELFESEERITEGSSELILSLNRRVDEAEVMVQAQEERHKVELKKKQKTITDLMQQVRILETHRKDLMSEVEDEQERLLEQMHSARFTDNEDMRTQAELLRVVSEERDELQRRADSLEAYIQTSKETQNISPTLCISPVIQDAQERKAYNPGSQSSSSRSPFYSSTSSYQPFANIQASPQLSESSGHHAHTSSPSLSLSTGGTHMSSTPSSVNIQMKSSANNSYPLLPPPSNSHSPRSYNGGAKFNIFGGAQNASGQFKLFGSLNHSSLYGLSPGQMLEIIERAYVERLQNQQSWFEDMIKRGEIMSRSNTGADDKRRMESENSKLNRELSAMRVQRQLEDERTSIRGREQKILTDTAQMCVSKQVRRVSGNSNALIEAEQKSQTQSTQGTARGKTSSAYEFDSDLFKNNTQMSSVNSKKPPTEASFKALLQPTLIPSGKTFTASSAAGTIVARHKPKSSMKEQKDIRSDMTSKNSQNTVTSASSNSNNQSFLKIHEVSRKEVQRLTLPTQAYEVAANRDMTPTKVMKKSYLGLDEFSGNANLGLPVNSSLIQQQATPVLSINSSLITQPRRTDRSGIIENKLLKQHSASALLNHRF